MPAYKLRCYDGTHTHDITSYEITSDTVTLTTSTSTIDLFDTQYLIVLSSEKPTLLKDGVDDGVHITIQRDQYLDAINFATQKKSKKKKTHITEE